jgi:hypothetical protein
MRLRRPPHASHSGRPERKRRQWPSRAAFSGPAAERHSMEARARCYATGPVKACDVVHWPGTCTRAVSQAPKMQPFLALSNNCQTHVQDACNSQSSSQGLSVQHGLCRPSVQGRCMQPTRSDSWAGHAAWCLTPPLALRRACCKAGQAKCVHAERGRNAQK